jgi:hypothetical protein
MQVATLSFSVARGLQLGFFQLCRHCNRDFFSCAWVATLSFPVEAGCNCDFEKTRRAKLYLNPTSGSRNPSSTAQEIKMTATAWASNSKHKTRVHANQLAHGQRLSEQLKRIHTNRKSSL